MSSNWLEELEADLACVGARVILLDAATSVFREGSICGALLLSHAERYLRDPELYETERERIAAEVWAELRRDFDLAAQIFGEGGAAAA